jgi:hypothetical protein
VYIILYYGLNINSIPVILWLNVVSNSEDVVGVLVCVDREGVPEFKVSMVKTII